MARKGAAATTGSGEPRRSSRIKDQAKPDPPPKKTLAKPRARKPKATGEEGDAGNKEKPKSAARGKKRTAAEKEAEYAEPAVNGEDAPPPAKKAKPDSDAAAKPASKSAAKPPSKAAVNTASKAAATETTVKPASKAAAPEAGVKPASKATAKPASRAGSRKPVSKADVEKKNDAVAPTQASIVEEPEAEAAAT